MKKILFISGSVGLGHVSRDIEIAKEIRKQKPNIEIFWIAGEPASTVLKNSGEQLLELMNQGEELIDKASASYKINLADFASKVRKQWAENGKKLVNIIDDSKFDLVIGDEAGDLFLEVAAHPNHRKWPHIAITDYIGLEATSKNPLEYLICKMINRTWAKGFSQTPPIADKNIFIGELEDIPQKSNFLFPHKREIAQKYYDFVGYILPFNPKEYEDKKSLRQQLGYGKEPLIICSIGGTKAGALLLNLCKQAYPLIKKDIPNLKMILVCGPTLQTEYIEPVDGIEIRGYVPKLYEHLAAADLCIVTGGGTITLELTALHKPFLYFPLEGHFEQRDVAARVTRHKAGVQMLYSQTNPQMLADAIISNINRQPQYLPISTNGAIKAAQIIKEFL